MNGKIITDLYHKQQQALRFWRIGPVSHIQSPGSRGAGAPPPPGNFKVGALEFWMNKNKIIVKCAYHFLADEQHSASEDPHAPPFCL